MSDIRAIVALSDLEEGDFFPGPMWAELESLLRENPNAIGFRLDDSGVDGEWTLVFSKQGTKSPRFQKLVGKGEKAGKTSNVFDISSMTFSGEATVLKKGKVASTVKVCYPTSTSLTPK